jgi:4-alpha-glucanotransferase
LATLAGLIVNWRDAAGQPQVVAPDSLRAVLAAMGLPAETDTDISASRDRLAKDRADAVTFVTADASAKIDIPIQAVVQTARLTLEDGDTRFLSVIPNRNGISLIAPERPGYHSLEVDDRVVTLAVAPPSAFTVGDAAPGRKLWGTAVQVYSLREAREGAFGDFGDLARFARAAGQRGADALAISPIHAIFLADESRYGPYAPSTRLFLNSLYADPKALFGDEARGDDSRGELIDWAAAIPEKRRRLREAFEQFRASHDEGLVADLQRFRQGGGDDLRLHAVFEALHGHFFTQAKARGWQNWPEPFHDPAGTAVAQFVHAHADQIDFHIFLQWLADRNLAAAHTAAKDSGMAVGLIADLAVGMDAGGSQAWSRRDDILNGLNVGAPPDLFQPKGQDWGIAAFSPQALRRNGFTPFLATIQAALRHAGGMRIDHAMGLRRLWLSPHGGEAKHGAYLTYPFEDMLRLVKLESFRARAIIVGEDLGTVPEGFREDLSEADVMGMRVLWFERNNAGFIPAAEWPKGAMAMTSTHDLPTVAGWWRGRDIDWAAEIGAGEEESRRQEERKNDRRALWDAFTEGGAGAGAPPPPENPESAVDAAVAFVASTACDLALVPVEDLLGLVEQVNLPGVVDEHPNWRRRLPAPAETLLNAPAVKARIDHLNRLRPR